MSRTTAKGVRSHGDRFTTFDMIVMAVCAAAFGAAALFITLLDHAATQVFGLYGGYLAAGLLNAPGITGAYVIRKRGTAFITQNLFGLAQLAFGNPYGASLLWYTLAESIGQELVLAVFLYRRWGNVTLAICGIVSFAAAQVPTYVLFGFGAMPVWSWLAPMALAGAPSAAVCCLILPRLTLSVLATAGLTHVETK